MAKKAISVNSLRQKQFKTLAFTGEWLENMGEPERNFRAVFYGPGGSGKSTYVLKFANYLGKHFGKVLYNSFEEGISKSLQTRCVQHGIDAKRLYFYDRLTFDEFCEKMKRGYYRVGIIDSLQYMNFTYAQYRKLVKLFPTKAFIFISQVNNAGKTKGGSDILHAVDIKIHVIGGQAHIQSRYAPGSKTVQLFGGQQEDINLFTYQHIQNGKTKTGSNGHSY